MKSVSARNYLSRLAGLVITCKGGELMRYHKLFVAVLIVSVMGVLPVQATPLLATFDSFSEGDGSLTLSDGGITFSNLDTYGGSTSTFVIDAVSSTSVLGLSPPNVLSFGGHNPGLGFGFSRFGSAQVTFGAAPAFEATMDVYSLPRDVPNVLTLEALLGGTPVASSSISFNLPDTGVLHQMLSVSGVTFDELRLVSSGPDQNGAVFIVLDNVRVTTVPEPISAILLSVGLLALVAYRWRLQPLAET